MSCLLSYTISITGDCLNDLSGAFSLDILGSAPDYTIQWISPYTGTTSLGVGIVNYSETGLSGGTYTFKIIDSCSPANTVLPVNVYISTGTCVSIVSQQNTLCGLNNGSVTATTSNLYGTGSFYLYEMSDGYITSGITLSSSYGFGSLSAGTYYVVANDGGGCTGKSETCIIKDSLPLEIGLYTVNDAGCAVNSGSIHITGLTGTPPYTYLWSPGGQTTQSITGLTAGPYIVTVTDGSGCVQSSGVTVTTVPNVGLGAFTVESPSCFSADGEVTITITGGTAPYYYSGSNGTVAVSFATTYTFTGLSSGVFSVQVTDAGLCNFTSSTSLLTPGGLSVTSVNITNSACNNTSGKIQVTIFGGSAPYTYTLTDSLGNSTVITGSFTSWTFNGLSSGNYTLTISDMGPCVFTHAYTINNVELFTLSVETTGTTCNLSDGAVTLNITSGGTGPYNYEIDGQFTIISDLSYTFTDLPSGNYTATVTDNNGCAQILPFTINNSSTVDFVLVGTDSTNGTNGTIDTFITSGEPPFILNWSSNVNGQTGLTINSLSAGTYTLTVIDDNGCVQTRDIIINGFNVISTYQTFNICDEDFMNTGQTVRKGPQQMLTEGFYDLTSGDTNCLLQQTIFYAEVTVSGNTQTQPFYTGTTLNDYPLDSLFYDVVKEILLSYEGVGEVLLDYLNNIITIDTNCNSNVSLIDVDVKIDLKISYDIDCQSCGLPTPTPTPTPTLTPTPTPTPTLATLPTVTTDGYANLGNGSAQITGTIVSNGGSTITQRGIVWGTSPNPTIANNIVSDGSGNPDALGQFIHTYIIPNPHIPVYVRIYATNAVGTSYGAQVSFTMPCFIKGTKITLASGLKKNIEDISYEDSLLVWNFDEGRFDSATPLWIMTPVLTQYVNILFSDGSKLGISGHLNHDGGHRIFNLDKGEFTYAIPNEHSPIGTRTFNDKGNIVTIVGKEESTEVEEIYNVVTNRHLNIFAEGILTSRRLNNLYPIADMKFIKDERSITSIEEFKGVPVEYYEGLRLGEQPLATNSEGFLVKTPKELAYTLPTVGELTQWTVEFIKKKL